MSKRKRGTKRLVTGSGVSLCSMITLLWVYSWIIVPPGPDYYTRKLHFMFKIPDPGYTTWLGILPTVRSYFREVRRIRLRPFHTSRVVDPRVPGDAFAPPSRATAAYESAR